MPVIHIHRQRGLSLVEMMVALAISSFLILGVTQVYIDNKARYEYQQGQIGNQESGRFTLLLLQQQLSKTGYRRLPQDTIQIAFPALASTNGCPAFSAGTTYQLTADGTGICFRYQGAADGTDTDCLGNAIANNATVLSRISYVASATVGAGTLTCTAQGAAAQTFISGLADFKFFTPPASTANSLAISYAALLATTSSVRGGISSDVATRWNSVSGNTLSDAGKYAFQIAQGTVTLRNLMP
jgi:type IV pilus assembly protein PilW